MTCYYVASTIHQSLGDGLCAEAVTMFLQLASSTSTERPSAEHVSSVAQGTVSMLEAERCRLTVSKPF